MSFLEGSWSTLEANSLDFQHRSHKTGRGSMMDRLMYRVLGPLTVVRGSRVCALGGSRQRMVLAVLLANSNRLVSQDVLVDAVWDGDPPPAARNSLHSYISNLRRELGPGEIARDGRGYRLAVDHDTFDALQLQLLSERGHAALASDPKGAAVALDEALRLWQGSPFDDLGDHPALAAEVIRLTELRLSTEEDRFEAHLLLGDHQRVVPELRVLVNANPYRERFQAQLMLALYRSGRQADALRVFKDSHQRLVDDLGIDPSAELWRLEEQILRHDVSLAAPTAAEMTDQQQIARGASIENVRGLVSDRAQPNQIANGPVHRGGHRPISRTRRRALGVVLLAGFAAAGIVNFGDLGITPTSYSFFDGCGTPPQDLTAWWTGDKTTGDEIGGRAATLVNGATFEVGLVNEAFGLSGSGAFVEVPQHSAIDAGLRDFTVDLWINFNDTGGEQILVEKWVQRFESPSFGWTFTKLEGNEVGFIGETFGAVSDPLSIPQNTWIHFAARREADTVEIFMNGNLIVSRTEPGVAVDLNSESSIKFGHRGSPDDTPGSEDDRGFFLNGQIDEVHLVVGRALTEREIGSIVVAGTRGWCHPISA